jgi:hypothetical protein
LAEGPFSWFLSETDRKSIDDLLALGFVKIEIGFMRLQLEFEGRGESKQDNITMLISIMHQ